jgi:hypothetical protein
MPHLKIRSRDHGQRPCRADQNEWPQERALCTDREDVVETVLRSRHLVTLWSRWGRGHLQGGDRLMKYGVKGVIGQVLKMCHETVYVDEGWRPARYLVYRRCT